MATSNLLAGPMWKTNSSYSSSAMCSKCVVKALLKLTANAFEYSIVETHILATSFFYCQFQKFGVLPLCKVHHRQLKVKIITKFSHPYVDN